MHPLLKEIERENDPHDVLEIAPDVVLASRPDKDIPPLAPGAIAGPAPPPNVGSNSSVGAAAPSLDAAVRAEDIETSRATQGRSPIGTWARRVSIGFLLAMCGVAVANWQNYGEAAKQMIAGLAPRFVTTASPQANAAPSEQSDSPDIQAAANAASSQAATPAQPAEAVALPSPRSAAVVQSELLQSMAQQIGQLKASIEQLKAGQEQMSRDIARNSEVKTSEAKASEIKTSEIKASEQNARPRISGAKTTAPLAALPPRPIAAPARKPKPAISAAQYVPPPPSPTAEPAPPQATVETDGNPVVRPPLPLR